MSVSYAHPSQWKEVVLANPSIDRKKWYFTENDKEAVGKNILAFGFLLSVASVFFAFSEVFPVMRNLGGEIFLIVLVIVAGLSLVFLPKLAKYITTKRERNRDEYRAAHAHIIIDSLSSQGWFIDNKDALTTIITDENPYLRNAEGIRYYTRQLYIGSEDVSFILVLSDESVEAERERAEKQRRVAFLLSCYEEENGPISPERKRGFIAGAEASL